MREIALQTLVSFLDSELGLSGFPEDESANGLQVEGRAGVRRIGLAVDACEYVFREASESGIDLLLVHHGLIWGSIKSVKGLLGMRIKSLLDAGISLYACHLPLDAHPSYGNNAGILKTLGLKRMGGFGSYHGKKIGYWGRTDRPMQLAEFASLLDRRLKAKSTFIDFRKKVRNVGVVSGAGWSVLSDMERPEIDTFVTGEPSHSAYPIAEELGINLVFSGHYATETVGIRSVEKMLSKKLGIETRFIDHPTGL